jgi:hypothetical protein
MPSSTYAGYAILRSNLKSGSDSDVAKAVAYGKRVKIYPFSRAAHPPETVFVDTINSVYDNIIPYDQRFFEELNTFIQREPWLQRDRAMIDQLKFIGIDNGKPFSPDTATRDILKQAAVEAHESLQPLYEKVFQTPFNEGAHWAFPASAEFAKAIQSDYADPDIYPVDTRGLTYSFAYFSAKHIGAGQYYLMTINDKAGQPFDGATTYRLNVPANPPVTLYWSATAYDRTTHALIRNMQWSSRASTTPGLQKNSDGSVDVYFAPKAVAGKESNWIPTDGNGKFEVLFRFYGPQKPLFDKTWKLPDIEKVQ